jgi:hypothetical protein
MEGGGHNQAKASKQKAHASYRKPAYELQLRRDLDILLGKNGKKKHQHSALAGGTKKHEKNSCKK